MKKLSILLVLVLISSVSFGAVKISIGNTINSFADARIAGVTQSMGIAYDLADLEIGWVLETSPLTFTDEQDGNVRSVNVNVCAIRVTKALNDLVGIGVEMGSLGCGGTAGIASASPLMGVFGTVNILGSKSKDVSSNVSARIGGRIADIYDCNPATTSNVNVANLNSLGATLLITIGF